MLLDNLFKKFSKPHKPDHFFIFIESPIKIVAGQLFLWGQASWWPIVCNLDVRPVMGVGLAVGSKFQIRIQGLIKVKLEAEVTNIVPQRLIEMTFTKGMLKGKEIISLEERYNGTRMDVTLDAQPKGIFNQALWKFFFQKSYGLGIKKIIELLRNYCLSVQRL